jgi:hypothetical protein
MGPPGQNGLENLHTAFAGYTPTAFTGNLGGRTGAHAACNAAFAGSHFCTDWELDQSVPPAPAQSVWVDPGEATASSRFFRPPYSPTDGNICMGWTKDQADLNFGGIVRGQVYTPLGALAPTFISNTDGGCETPHQLACCIGGTSVRFRGFTAPTTAKLGGRTGATAKCSAAFSGSHFCTDWEIDQAALHGPIPSVGAWVDAGNAQPTSRLYHGSYTTDDTNSCGGWTIDQPNTNVGGTTTRANILTPLGEITTSFVSLADGGCEVPRPLPCCDGGPPQ